ncbi:MAG: YIP1 family protein [Armatimonadetes bacterium]|nr:YIP1 family protein [Armatimonadota bacterium]
MAPAHLDAEIDPQSIPISPSDAKEVIVARAWNLLTVSLPLGSGHHHLTHRRDAIAVAMTGAVAPRVSSIRSVLGILTNPKAVFQQHLMYVPAPLCLLVSGLAFGMFYLQTALDVSQRDWRGIVYTIALTVLGLAVGTVGVGLLAAIAWALTRPFGGKHPIDWAVRAFGLAYAPTLIYAGLGMVANVVLGWNTALAFGVTGLLWALGPMIVAIREMTGERTGISVVIATVCGALMLALWALIFR